jgi:phage anti-repressor protein
MLELRDTEHGKLISSRELHNKISVSHNSLKYMRWTRLHIHGIALKGKDYFEGHYIKTRAGLVPDILISVELARSLCLMTKTKPSLRIREWLFEYELTCIS